MIIQDLKDSSTLTQFQFEVNAWIRLVEFLNQETTYLKNRLSEVIDQIKDRENLALAEHFQNQFIVQRNNIDELGHSIKMNEQRLVNEVNANPVAVDHRKVENHEAEADFIGYFEKNFAELRAEYNVFLSKWM